MSKGGKRGKGGRKPIRRSEFGGRGATIAGIVVLAAFGCLALLSILRVRVPFPDLSLPAQFDSPSARVIMVIAALFALPLTGAAVFKAFEIRRARRWPSVPGRIVSSRRMVESGRDKPEGLHVDREIAHVEFEYEVAGVLYASRRITTGERVAGDDIEPLLARYPAGAAVTVHYDPKEPANGIVERDAPEGMLRGCLVVLALGVGLTAFAMRLATEGPGFILPFVDLSSLGLPSLGQALPHVNWAFLFAMLVFSASFMIAVGVMARATLAARRWPTTRGQVLSTSVRQHAGDGAARQFRPVVRYRYTVDGRDHEGGVIEHGRETSGGEGWAQRVIARYPVGSAVAVRYDPADPARAALSARFGVVGWILAAVCVLLLLVGMFGSGLL